MDIRTRQGQSERPLGADIATVDGAWDVNGIGLDNVLQIVAARYRIIFGTAAIIVALAVLLLFQLTPIFTASSRVLVGGRENQVIDIGAILSGLAMDNATVQNQIEILKSSDLLRRLVDKAELTKDPEFNSSLLDRRGLIARISEFLGFVTRPKNEDEAEPTLQKVVARLRNATNAELIGRSSVINISVSSVDPEKAAVLTNTLSDLYIIDQLEAKFEATRRATAWLNERIGQLADQLRQAETAVELYRVENNLTDANGRSIAQQQLADLNTQLTLVRAETSEKEAIYAQAKSLLETNAVDSIPEVIASPLIASLREQEALLIQEEGELSNRYGERHPRIIDIRTQRRTLAFKIKEEAERIVANLANEVSVVQARELSLQRTLNGLESTVSNQNRAGVRLRELERDAESSRILYETFLARSKQAQDQEDMQTPDARIISVAGVPQAPSFPRKGLTLAVMLPTSLVIGFLFAVALEHLSNGFRTNADIEQHLRIPSLGLVPHLGDIEAGESLSARVINKPMSSFAEAIRSLKLAIDLYDIDHPPKVVLVTSSMPSEGKTSIATSLARLSAASGKKTILIDADLRHPNVQQALGAEPPQTDLVGFLSSSIEVDRVVATDAISKLHYLPTRREQNINPSNLLASEKMKSLISALRKAYDVVIIDSAPLIPVTDTRMLALLADVSLFVVRWQETPREAARSALRMLVDLGVPVVGAAMSFVDMRRYSVYGYGYGGSSYYGRYYSKYYHD